MRPVSSPPVRMSEPCAPASGDCCIAPWRPRVSDRACDGASSCNTGHRHSHRDPRRAVVGLLTGLLAPVIRERLWRGSTRWGALRWPIGPGEALAALRHDGAGRNWRISGLTTDDHAAWGAGWRHGPPDRTTDIGRMPVQPAAEQCRPEFAFNGAVMGDDGQGDE